MHDDHANGPRESDRRREIANNLRAYVEAGIAPDFAKKLLAVAAALDEFTAQPNLED
jgi:5-carboxymethyl-2-hydroxymuconate isomerase